MRPRSSFRAALALSAAFSLLSAAPAQAGEIQVAGFAGGQGSTWRSDGSGFVALRLGYRFLDLVGPYFLGRAGYATVDQRVLELVQIGGQIWGRLGPTRPYARFGFVHQHEEPWSAVKADVGGALFGVGDGIRHRMGMEGGLGLDIPFKQMKSWQFHATVEAFLSGFPDSKGPPIYVGGTAGLGFNYAL
jgi:hypothetical protein